MTTYYIDPSAATNGNGLSTSTPFNSWSGITITSSNTYLQKENTIYVGSITVPVGATDVRLGVYDASSGSQVIDGSKRATINGTGTTLTVRVRETADRCSIIGLEVFGTDTGAERWAFYLGNTASAPANNTIVKHCVARDILPSGTNDCGGIKVFGSSVLIEDCVIYNVPTDGIFLQGNNCKILRNHIYRVGTDGRDFGDCIQLTGNATLGCSNSLISHNILDHRDGSYKQTVIIQDTSGGSSGGVVEHNVMYMSLYDGTNSNVIYIDVINCVVRSNKCFGGYYGIYLADNNALVCGNYIKNAIYGIDQGTSQTGSKVYNNTIVNCSSYGIYADTDTTFTAKNNMIFNCGVGIAIETGATEDYNWYYGNTTDQSSLGGAGPTWGSNNRTDNPFSVVHPDYSLSSFDACNYGTYIQGVSLINDRSRPGFTPIGAYQVGRV